MRYTKVINLFNMYVVNFEFGGKLLKKVAQNEKQLYKLIATYTNLNQKEREILYNKLKTKNVYL